MPVGRGGERGGNERRIRRFETDSDRARTGVTQQPARVTRVSVDEGASETDDGTGVESLSHKTVDTCYHLSHVGYYN